MDVSGIDILNINLKSGENNARSTATSFKETGKTEDRKAEIHKVAKEMEALFIYQLMKVMRETTENMAAEDKSLGNDTYMNLFDMEVSKVMADRGFGLGNSLEKFLQRKVEDTQENKF